MNLVRSRSWGQVKPAPDAQVDWGHPISNELVFASVQNGMPFDLVTHTGPTARTTGLLLTGRGTYRATATSGAFDFTTAPVAKIGTKGLVTIVAFHVWNGASIAFGGSTTYTDSSGAASGAYSLQGNNDGTFGGFANGVYISLASPTTGVPFMQSVRGGSGASTLYDRWTTNGTRLSASGVTANPASGASKIRVHTERSAAQSFPGYVTTVYAWSRILRREELQHLAAEPFAFIAPPGPRILYLPLVPSNDQTVALTPATVTVSPQAESVTPGSVSLAESPATVTVTPQTQALQASSSLALAPATITTTAQALALTPAAVSLGLTPASIVATAQTLAQTLGAVSLALAPSSVTTTAQPLTVAAGGASIGASPATITATGQPLGLFSGTSLALAPASIAATAQVLGITPAAVAVPVTPATITTAAAALGLVPGTTSTALSPAIIQAAAQILGLQRPTIGTGDWAATITGAGFDASIDRPRFTATVTERTRWTASIEE